MRLQLEPAEKGGENATKFGRVEKKEKIASPS